MRTIGLGAIAVVCVISATLAFRQSSSIAAPPTTTAPVTGPSSHTTNPTTAPTTMPAIPIRYDTTRILGPLKPDGTVDYMAAINEQSSKGVTKDNNAAIVLLQALDPTTFLQALQAAVRQEVMRRLDVKLPDKGEYFHGFLSGTIRPANDPEKKFHDKAATQPWKADECPSLAKWLKDNEGPLAKIVEASKRQRYYVPMLTAKPDEALVGAMLPSVSYFGQVTKALAVRADLAIGEGRFDDAWNDIKAGYRLGALAGQGATLVEKLVAINCMKIMDDVTANMVGSPIPQQTIKTMLKEFGQLPATPKVTPAIDICERYFFLDSCLTIYCGQLKAVAGNSGDMNVLAKAMGRERGEGIAQILKTTAVEEWARIWSGTMAWVNDYYDEWVKAADEPIRADRIKKLAALKSKIPKVDDEDYREALKRRVRGGDAKARTELVRDLMIAVLLPSINRIQTLADMSATKRQLVTVALALAAYNGENKKYPDKLSDLAPKYLKAVPVDLFSGQPILYKANKDGCVVYSVGENMKDDGGKDKEHGGDDIVVMVGR
jgi:hypothetical protein